MGPTRGDRIRSNIVLGTNSVSEIIRGLLDARFREWYVMYPVVCMFITTITEAELWQGVYRLDPGKRRRGLSKSVEEVIRLFSSRVLPFDRFAAMEYARLVDVRRRNGLGIDKLDVMIAAIANTNGMTVVTGDEKHFSGMGVEVFNPWRQD